MDTQYEDIDTEDDHKATTFRIKTKKGSAMGLFSEETIYVHAICGRGAVKGLMSILVNKFKTNKITFTPLINCNVENSIRGEVKWLKADDPRNPYGEPMKYLECEWTD